MTCHACGADIPLSDFEEHRAVMILRRRYCRDCTVLPSSPWADPSKTPVLKLSSRLAEISRQILGQKQP
jgi:hypothetical protein